VGQHIAPLIQRRHFTATLETGVDGQHPAAMDGRLEQQLAQVADEDLHRMPFRLLAQLAAGLAFQAGNNEPHEGIAHTLPEKLTMWMIVRDRYFLRLTEHGVDIGFDFHSQDVGPFSTIDGQRAMGR